MVNDSIGLIKAEVSVSVKVLNAFLANSYVLVVKVQNFHWNVKDQRFYMLHEFFGDQYKDLVDAIDEIAERIRMLGEYVSASMSSYLDQSAIEEVLNVQSGDSMLQSLAKDHCTIIDLLRGGIGQISQTQDQGTLDFLIGRLQYHEKILWMIKSHL
jgi:starvation-inducible DNA-binding protein